MKNRVYIAILSFISMLPAVLQGQIAQKREVVTQGFSTFVPNQGQWSDDFYNKVELGYGNLFTDKNGFKLMLWNQKQTHPMSEEFHLYKDLKSEHIIDFCALHFDFLHGNSQAAPVYTNPASWKNNYYLGNDEQQWASNVQPYYQSVKKEVYTKINFYHSTLGNAIKSEWHVQAQGNPDLIKIGINGADSMRVIEGNLMIYTTAGVLIEKAPVAWQTIENNKVKVSVSFQLVDNILSFLVGTYNTNYPLVIDPLLVFSTYSGSVSDNFGFTATYDSKGRLYAGGISNNISGKYPVTPGAFQDTFRGGNNNPPVNLPSDITISKYSADGSTLLYATYLGGTLNDFPHSLVVNSKDELYILGTTFSTNFPTKKAYDNSQNGGADIVLVHFNEDGSQLLQSTYIGGSGSDGLNAPTSAGTLGYNYADDFRGDILTDSMGNVYVAICTESSNFPVSDSAVQKTKAGGRDAIIFSFDSTLSKLRFSTYWGGSGDDAAYSVKINSNGTVYVGGGTASADFPSKGNVYKSTYQGGRADGFVLKLDSVYGKIEKSSLFGTSVYDQAYFIEIDLNDRVYLAGQTEGNLARTTGTYGKDNTSQFVACLDSNLLNLQFQTTFGNRINDPELSPSAFLVDNCFNIYYSGWGSDIGGGHIGTTTGLQTKNANWPTTDGNDFYLIVMNKEARGLIYASYIGGTQSGDHVDGGTSRFDKSGIVYQSVCASCPPPGSTLSDFPTTASSAFPVNSSIRCSNASFKLDFQISYSTEAKFNIPPKSCFGKIVSFNNTGSGTSFIWDFGDGSPKDTAKNPTHAYKQPGIYKITLYAIDSLSCNLADTVQSEIEILESPTAGFEADYDPCIKGIVTFKDDATQGTQFWNYGDGNTTNQFMKEYIYGSDGQYEVSQEIKLPNGCADTFTKKIILASNPGGALQLYNVFTPNGDNFNSCWEPDGINTACEEAKFRIYNRYGLLVFSSQKHGTCWNGKLFGTGADAANGTYYYVLQVKRKDSENEKEVYGVISLLR